LDGLRRFVEAWGRKSYPPDSVSEADIAALEAELGVAFPKDYRRSIIAVGAPSPTTALWDWLWDHDLPLGSVEGPTRHSLAQFYTPDEIRDALVWRDAGMPTDLIPFACDNGGNQICFSIRELSSTNAPKGTVFFWDHDFLDTSEDGETFGAWLETYLPK
jgi:cell wall assembly regulator SMI1